MSIVSRKSIIIDNNVRLKDRNRRFIYDSVVHIIQLYEVVTKTLNHKKRFRTQLRRLHKLSRRLSINSKYPLISLNEIYDIFTFFDNLDEPLNFREQLNRFLEAYSIDDDNDYKLYAAEHLINFILKSINEPLDIYSFDDIGTDFLKTIRDTYFNDIQNRKNLSEICCLTILTLCVEIREGKEIDSNLSSICSYDPRRRITNTQIVNGLANYYKKSSNVTKYLK